MKLAFHTAVITTSAFAMVLNIVDQHAPEAILFALGLWFSLYVAISSSRS